MVYYGLPRTKGIALAVLPIVPALLSIAGSCAILSYLFCRVVRFGTYERLLLGMSVFDIIFSVTLALQPFLAPRNHYELSIGNDVTCTAMGTLHQFGLGSFFYYGMLSLYFLLTLRFGIKPEKIAHRVEPFMHALSITWPLTTSIFGAVKGWYNSMELFPGCWSDGFRGNSIKINWIIAVGWQLLTCLLLIINNTLIYFHVRRSYAKAITGRSSIMDMGSPENSEFMMRPNNGSQTTQQPQQTPPLSPQQQPIQGSLNNLQQERLQLVFSQCTLYVMAFFLTQAPFLATRAVENNYNRKRYMNKFFALLVVQAICTPLSGFFNAIIFFRPRYLALRGRRDHAGGSSST